MRYIFLFLKDKKIVSKFVTIIHLSTVMLGQLGSEMEALINEERERGQWKGSEKGNKEYKK